MYVDLDIEGADISLESAHARVVDILEGFNTNLQELYPVELQDLSLADWLVTTSGYKEKSAYFSFHAKLLGFAWKDCYEVGRLIRSWPKYRGSYHNVEGVDMAVYNRRPFRVTWASKEGEGRPLVPVQLTTPSNACTKVVSDFGSQLDYWLQSLVTYTKDYQVLELPPLPEDVPWPRRLATATKDITGKTAKAIFDEVSDAGPKLGVLCPPPELVEKLLPFLHPSFADQYTLWYQVCVVVARTASQPGNAKGAYGGAYGSAYHDRLFAAFYEFSSRSSKFNSEAVVEKWKSAKRMLESRHNTRGRSLTWRSLARWGQETVMMEPERKLREDLGKQLRAILNGYFFPVFQVASLLPDYTGGGLFNVIEDHSAWCKPIPRPEVASFFTPRSQLRVYFMNSPMGSGKTHQIIDYLKGKLQRQQSARIIGLSHRITLSCDIQRRFNEAGVPIRSYREFEGRENYDVSHVQLLVISPESLKRVVTHTQFDVVVMDECESVLAQFSSSTTMGENIVDSSAALIEVLKKAGYVIMGDGIPTQRTIDFMGNTFRGERIEVYVNYGAEDGNMRHARILTGVSPGVMLFRELKEYMRLGGVPVLVSNSKTFADNVYNAIQLDPVLKHRKVAYYSAATDKRQMDRDFADVERAWADVDLLMYTPVVGPGVDFCGRHFGKCFVYCSPNSCNGRDIIQMTRRVRFLEEKEALVFAVDNNLGPTTGAKTLEEAVVRLKQTKEELVKYYQRVLDNTPPPISFPAFVEILQGNNPFNGGVPMTETDREQLLERFKARLTLSNHEVPDIIFTVLVWNQLENDLWRNNFLGMLRVYLPLTGHTVSEEEHHERPEDSGLGSASVVSYTDIRELSSLEVDDLRVAQNRRLISPTDELALMRYFFDLQFVRAFGPRTTQDDRAFIFDGQYSNAGKRVWYQHYLASCMDDHELCNDVAEKSPFLELGSRVPILKGTIHGIAQLLNLRSFYDLQTTFTSKDLLDNASRLSALMADYRQSAKLKDRSRKSDVSIQKLVKGLRMIFRHWGGMSIESKQVARDRSGGGDVHTFEYRLSPESEYIGKLIDLRHAANP
jgi:hypothetical protein